MTIIDSQMLHINVQLLSPIDKLAKYDNNIIIITDYRTLKNY